MSLIVESNGTRLALPRNCRTKKINCRTMFATIIETEVVATRMDGCRGVERARGQPQSRSSQVEIIIFAG